MQLDQKKIIQEIVDAALSVARPGWKCVVLSYHVDDTQSNFLNSCLIEEGGVIVERGLPYSDELDVLFRQLRKCIAGSERQAFTSCSLRVEESGKFEATYGYDPVDWNQLIGRTGNFRAS